MKKALVFGASGQAGSYLVEQLVAKSYQVNGVGRATTVYKLDLKNEGAVHRLLQEYQPDEIYNLAAVMYAPGSWKCAKYVIDINGVAVVTMLDAILKHCPEAHFVQAGSAETATTPYGIAKDLAAAAVRMYREEKGLHASTAIFYNMESPRRSDFFFAQKVVKEIVNFLKTKEPFQIGPLYAVRDWGWAPEYMEAMQLIAGAETPKDYVIATGESHSCKAFVVEAFRCVGIEPYLLKISPERYYIEEESVVTPTMMYANPLDISATYNSLGWRAEIKFQEVIKRLVQAELEKQQVKL